MMKHCVIFVKGGLTLIQQKASTHLILLKRCNWVIRMFIEGIVGKLIILFIFHYWVKGFHLHCS